MSSQPASHTGIFREENSVLRRLFGYEDALNLNPGALLECEPLEGSDVKDLMLVCVDIDTWQGGGYIAPNPEYHIGITILDTHDVLASLRSPNNITLAGIPKVRSPLNAMRELNIACRL